MRTYTEVADGVLVTTSRRMSTSSTVLVTDDACLLIDPAWMPDELDALSSDLTGRGWRVIGGFATHAHQDHLLWHPGFGTAPRWASVRTAELADQERATLVGYLGSDFPEPLVALMGDVSGVEGTIPRESVPGGFDPELIVHDGHAPGHTALWIPSRRVLVAGDMLSDVEIPLPFYPDDLPSYLNALDVLAEYARRAEVVVPGHGAPGQNALQRVDTDRRFLDAVMAGRRPEDDRLRNPGMAEAYEHLTDMVADR